MIAHHAEAVNEHFVAEVQKHVPHFSFRVEVVPAHQLAQLELPQELGNARRAPRFHLR